MLSFRTTTNSTLISPEISLTRKHCSVKPNTQQSKKMDKRLTREDEKCMAKEINSIETDAPIVDTSEIGCVIFFIFSIIFKILLHLFIIVLFYVSKFNNYK